MASILHGLTGQSKSDVTKRKMSEALKRRWQNPNYRKLKSEQHIKKWQEPEFRQKVIKAKKEKWSDKEFRAKMILIMQQSHNTPDYIIALKQRLKELWKREDYREKHTGQNHFMWRGGVSFLHYPPEFNDFLKELIKQRDNHICQNPDCPETKLPLTVHHIDYKKSNNHPSNLITLYNSCNPKANFNKKYWKTILQKKLETNPNNIENGLLTLNNNPINVIKNGIP